MATYEIANPGNIAMQQEIWTLLITEAQAALTVLAHGTGSYWHQAVAQPTRRAARTKNATVKIYTAGFSSSELSNALYATGSTVARG